MDDNLIGTRPEQLPKKNIAGISSHARTLWARFTGCIFESGFQESLAFLHGAEDCWSLARQDEDEETVLSNGIAKKKKRG